MKKILVFLRPDDKEIFSRNEDGTYSNYSLKVQFPYSLIRKYPEEHLLKLKFIPLVDGREGIN